MKLKNLRKKIRRLEARLQEGPKKLAKLKRKLDAMAAAKARKDQRKAAARAVARQTVKSSTPTQKQNGRLAAKPQMKSRSAKRPSAPGPSFAVELTRLRGRTISLREVIA
jgi:predicted  nucleic acid-binding Zn-ribbon protein